MLQKLNEQFEHNQLFRRLVVIFMCCLIAGTTYESFFYAKMALGMSGVETAAIIATIQIPITYLAKFVSELYWQGKKK